MTSFDIEDFYKKYVAKKKIDMRPYLLLPKLKNYSWLSDNKYIYQLISGETHIFYIKSGHEFPENRCTINEIEDGGIFISAGNYVNGKYIPSKDFQCVTHLRIRSNSSKIKKQEDIRTYYFIINIKNYNIFYNNEKNTEFEIHLIKKK